MFLIENIGELACVPPGPIGGRRMRDVRVIRDAAVLIDGTAIAAVGPRSGVESGGVVRRLDAGGGAVVPGLVDCHTHTVFAGSRAAEFAERCAGRTYLEIAEAGGGIKATVAAVRAASEPELIELARARLARMLAAGTTTVEIKSGYGLTVADELKMLRVIRAVRDVVSQDIVATYLAAHTTPAEFDGRPDAYLDTVLAEEVLAEIQREGLAEFCDVFTEAGAFDLAQSRRVLETALRHGLRPRLHADQITQMGATRLAGEVGAVSADHLETVDDAGIAALKQAGTIGVLLPACSFFLGVPQAPARRLVAADLPIALATDLNPGSAMVESLALTMSMACTQMKLTPTEALVAATANAAAVIGRQHRLGCLEVGCQADLLILNVPSHIEWPYHVGRNCVRTVVKRGAVVLDAA